MRQHTVRQGECIASIAESYGFFWDTLWNLPENAQLQSSGEQQTILLPGQVVSIPDLRQREDSCASEQRHRFRRKGTPAILRLCLMRPIESEPPHEQDRGELPGDEPPEEEPLAVVEEDEPASDDEEEEPWANARYVLDIDGKLTEGQTDGDGKLEVAIPPAAQEGKLTIEPGTERERVFLLRLGWLDPSASVSGVADRLNNLGFHDGSRPAAMTPALEQALRAFQKCHNLEESGEIDQATVEKLREAHGS